MKNESNTPATKRRFFSALRKSVGKILKSKSSKKEPELKSLQWIPRDMLSLIERKYPHPHKSYWINQGIPHVKTPLKVLPFTLTYKKAGSMKKCRIELSYALHPDHRIETGYLMMGHFPYEKQDGAVLYEIEGGVLDGLIGSKQTFENVLRRWEGKRKIAPGYLLAIATFLKDIHDLQHDGNYLLKREIPNDKFVELPAMKHGKRDFVYSNFLPIPKAEPVSNPAPATAI